MGYVMLKKFFKPNVKEDERAAELRRLNEALRSRVKHYRGESAPQPPKPNPDKSE